MFLRGVVGIGSSSQLLFGDLCIILATSCSERTEKLSIIGGLGVTKIGALFTGTNWSLFILSSSHILEILDTKKLLNWVACSLSVKPGGKQRSQFLPSKLSQILKISFELTQW